MSEHTNTSFGPSQVQNDKADDVAATAEAEFEDEIDLEKAEEDANEAGQFLVSESTARSPRVRDQSKRFSAILFARTELSRISQRPGGGDVTTVSQEEESSGLKYWISEVATAKEHGGDYQARLSAAFRASLGSLTIFSVLVFPHQKVLGCVWIGNIFMHSSIQDSFGAAVTSAWDFAVSIVITTLLSMPVAIFFASLDTDDACVILPFAVFAMTFAIMTCPHLSSRNLMILVMWLIIATVVREEIEWWEPMGWTATYFIGLAVAVLVNLLPSTNFALKTVHVQLERLEKDFAMLLRQVKSYGENTAATPSESRAAIACIEMLHHRISKTVKTLQANLPAAKTELTMTCRRVAASNLEEWVNQADKLMSPLRSLRTALTHRVLGEEYQVYSPALKKVKLAINESIVQSCDRMLDAMMSCLAVCHAWADPSARRVVLPDIHEELEVALRESRKDFHKAMKRVAFIIRDNVGENNKQANMRLFAHLTRRMSSFNALFELAESLSQYLNQHNWESEELKDETDAAGTYSSAMAYFQCAQQCMEQKWLWHNPDTFRLALKTATGMALASLFVSVPYLWTIAAPFGVWPGLTIASVNLADTGSSFHKAGDRLFGTLLAAAYALLVTDLFPGNENFVKVPAIGIFTFIVIYLKENEHAYKFTYAATSIGSMLYGSIKNNFNIAGYIPKRIELIFVGICIFTVVELFLFPRSSRRMVEKLSLKFFPMLRDFVRQASITAQRMQTFSQDAKENAEYLEALLGDNVDPFQLEKLGAIQGELKLLSSKLKKELQSGIEEPHVGFSLQLDAKSYRGLSNEISECEVQAILILKAFRTLAKAYRDESNRIRQTTWPQMHADFLSHILRVAGSTCHKLLEAYPDGRLRPQSGNAVRAVVAASGLREFQDVRLNALSGWADIYSHATEEKSFKGVDPVSLMTISVATTYMLDLCRHLQYVGQHVENLAHSFPTSK